MLVLLPKIQPVRPQLFEQLAHLGVREPLADALRHDLAHVLGGLKILYRRRSELHPSCGISPQASVRRMLRVQDPQTEEKPPKRLRLAGLDAASKIRHALLPHAFEGESCSAFRS